MNFAAASGKCYQQFITLTVHLFVQHNGHEAACRGGLSASAETCLE